MLRISDLVAGYGKMKVLHGVDFAVRDGSFTSILGGNGCGKSTILKVVSGLVPVMSGDVKLAGKSIVRVKPHHIVREGIAHVTQGKDVFPSLSIAENLMLGAYVIDDKDIIQSDMKRVYAIFPRLREKRNQASGLLSGGEQQMLAIARGLMCRPKLLILDEPSAALSPKLTEDIFAKIAEIHRGGLTILLVEQNVRMALKYSDYAYILKDGRIVFEGEAKELLEHEDLKSFYLGRSKSH
ncbi:MAG: ABC transporter ATP-binding protein [Planctomycetota bacterium]|jgi:branched-chain amino acid transport system ATP-binding protein|nr:ABC transporter ATP-binding protein [Planctomycetota bacterium]